MIDAGQDETICIGDSVQLSAVGADNYLWIPNNDINNNNVNSRPPPGSPQPRTRRTRRERTPKRRDVYSQKLSTF